MPTKTRTLKTNTVWIPALVGIMCTSLGYACGRCAGTTVPGNDVSAGETTGMESVSGSQGAGPPSSPGGEEEGGLASKERDRILEEARLHKIVRDRYFGQRGGKGAFEMDFRDWLTSSVFKLIRQQEDGGNYFLAMSRGIVEDRVRRAISDSHLFWGKTPISLSNEIESIVYNHFFVAFFGLDNTWPTGPPAPDIARLFYEHFSRAFNAMNEDQRLSYVLYDALYQWRQDLYDKFWREARSARTTKGPLEDDEVADATKGSLVDVAGCLIMTSGAWQLEHFTAFQSQWPLQSWDTPFMEVVQELHRHLHEAMQDPIIRAKAPYVPHGTYSREGTKEFARFMLASAMTKNNGATAQSFDRFLAAVDRATKHHQDKHRGRIRNSMSPNGSFDFVKKTD